nr:hypothetical protein [Pseudomonas sp. HS-2]
MRQSSGFLCGVTDVLKKLLTATPAKAGAQEFRRFWIPALSLIPISRCIRDRCGGACGLSLIHISMCIRDSGNLEQGLIQQALDDAGGVVARAACLLYTSSCV